MESTQKQIIEINGVKMEVDMRHAKRIEHLAIGSRVKCLIKGYGAEYKVLPGVIVGFEPFQNLPSIVVAYLDTDYSSASIKFKSYNAQCSDFEIVADVDNNALEVNKTDILNKFDRELERKRLEMEEIEQKRDFFTKTFGVYFTEFSSADFN
jgi:hypothetical protein